MPVSSEEGTGHEAEYCQRPPEADQAHRKEELPGKPHQLIQWERSVPAAR